MRRMILPGIALAGLAAVTACSGGAQASSSGAVFAGSCTLLNSAGPAGLRIARVNFTNETASTAAVSGLVVEGWNNGARVGNATTRFHNPRHVRPGHTQSINVLVDGRAKKCDVTQFLA